MITASASSTTSVYLSWVTTYTPTTHTVSLSYGVYYRNSVTSDYIFYSETTLLQQTLTGLLPYTNYEMYVIAIGNLTSKYSNNVTVSTNQDTPSGPPVMLSAILTFTSIVLSWMPPEYSERHGIITLYTIIFDESTYFTTKREYTFAGLEEATEYEFRVAAFTSVGRGPFTAPFKVTTLSDAPSVAPQNVIGRVESNQTIFISFNPIPLIHQNGDISYIVYYTGLAYDTVERHLILPANVTQTILTSLKPNEVYTIFVVAENSQGSGPASQHIDVKTLEGLPTAAPASIALTALSPFSFSVMWEAVEPRHHNGMLLYYEVMYNTTDTELIYLTVNAPMLSVALTGLIADSVYQIQIRAYTSAGAGPFSSEYFISTLNLTCILCVNGKCTLQIDYEYICSCYPGFAGETCENNIDECMNVSCIHGSCKDKVNNYFCECDTGFKGQLCDKTTSTPTCGEEHSLNILWPDTAYGDTTMLPCSESDTQRFGYASRVCSVSGAWYPPEVNECKKSIYLDLEPHTVTVIDDELTLSAVVDILYTTQFVVCDDSINGVSGPTFFPGEMTILIAFIDNLLSAANRQNTSTRAKLVPELTPSFICILSAILDERNLEVFSLPVATSIAVSINELLTQIAQLNSENYDVTQTDPIFVSEENLHIYTSPLTSGQSILLPDYTLLAVTNAGLYPDSVYIPESEVSSLFSMLNGEIPVVSVVFSRYLGQAIGTHSLNSDLDSLSTIASGVILLQSNLGGNLTFSSSVSLTFGQPIATVSSFEFVCVYWDSLTGWIGIATSVTLQGIGSVSCSVTRTGSYSVLRSSLTASDTHTTIYIAIGAAFGVLCLFFICLPIFFTCFRRILLKRD